MRNKVVVICCMMLAVMVTSSIALAESDEKGRVTLPTANTAVVPNVVGMVYKSAIPVIQKAGFYATHKGGASLSSVKNKIVVSQTPAAGTRANKNTFVTVDVP